jgi:hypothetical protein
MESPTDMKQSLYYKDSIFRHVHNYNYSYKTWAKSRWYGNKLIDIFVKEFKAFDKEYYLRAIEN